MADAEWDAFWSKVRQTGYRNPETSKQAGFDAAALAAFKKRVEALVKEEEGCISCIFARTHVDGLPPLICSRHQHKRRTLAFYGVDFEE